MKKISLLTIACILMQSCNSQEKDLAKITFTEKLNNFFGDIPNKYEKDNSMINYQLYDVYSTQSERVLYFNGVDLSGYRDEKGKFGTNYVTFEFSKKDNILNYYSVQLYTKEKVNKLIEAINSKIGKPKYISMLLSNPKNSNPDALLWEDTSRFYVLSGATQNPSEFDVFDKSNLIIREKIISGPFQYYGDYLDKIDEKKLKKESYSYKKFVDDRNKEGYDEYLKNYRKP
jgi:hypothetical protein